jgi:hypothetical protein
VKANFSSTEGGNTMATNNSSKGPATTLRCGNIKATIWENTGEKGSFFAATFSRPFKDQSWMWRNGCVFRPKPATDSDASRPPVPTERGH